MNFRFISFIDLSLCSIYLVIYFKMFRFISECTDYQCNAQIAVEHWKDTQNLWQIIKGGMDYRFDALRERKLPDLCRYVTITIVLLLDIVT